MDKGEAHTAHCSLPEMHAVPPSERHGGIGSVHGRGGSLIWARTECLPSPVTLRSSPARGRRSPPGSKRVGDVRPPNSAAVDQWEKGGAARHPAGGANAGEVFAVPESCASSPRTRVMNLTRGGGAGFGGEVDNRRASGGCPRGSPRARPTSAGPRNGCKNEKARPARRANSRCLPSSKTGRF